ncbi:MAG: hypothetical protein M3Y75_04895 [Actinomycetota bacterium]|nr:hypothetical protein [Actinomycetota bacterium]
MTSLVGLGDQKRGKEKAEVDQDTVGFGDAELNRPGPERRECGEKRQPCDQSRRPIERTSKRRPAHSAKGEHADEEQPDRKTGDVALAQDEAPTREGEAQDQSQRTYQRR